MVINYTVWINHFREHFDHLSIICQSINLWVFYFLLSSNIPFSYTSLCIWLSQFCSCIFVHFMCIFSNIVSLFLFFLCLHQMKRSIGSKVLFSLLIFPFNESVWYYYISSQRGWDHFLSPLYLPPNQALHAKFKAFWHLWVLFCCSVVFYPM